MVRKLNKHVGLVPNWKKCWKWASIQISAGGLIVFSVIDVLQNSFNVVPPHILQKIPHGNDIVVWLFVINIAARLIQLKPKDKKDADKE